MQAAKLFAGALAVCVAVASQAQAEAPKSGLKTGAFVNAFNVRDVTGPAKGTTLCYRCRYGGSPVVSIFAREMDEKTVDLVKKVDAQIGKNSDMKAFVVLLTDDPDASEAKLAEVAKKNKIEHTPLTIFDGQAGPEAYQIDKEADVTVLMWNSSRVKENFGFGKGKLGEKDIEGIVAAASKLTK